MALIFMDGFEGGDLSLWDLSYGAAIIAAPSGLDGSYACDLKTTSAAHVSKRFATKSEIYIAFKYKFAAATEPAYQQPIVTFVKGENKLASLVRSSGTPHTLGAALGLAGTTLATSTTAPALNSIYDIEIHYKPHDTEGIFQVKINGTLEIDFTGDTTAADSTVDGVYFGQFPGIGFLGQIGNLDNVFMDDANWIGRYLIQRLVLAGEGTYSGYSGAYTAADEVPASDTDALETNEGDILSTYPTGDLTGSIETVKAVQVQARVESEGPVTPKNVKVVLKSGNTVSLSGGKPVPYGGDPHSVAHIWETDPNDSGAWNPDKANNLEIGAQSAS